MRRTGERYAEHYITTYAFLHRCVAAMLFVGIVVPLVDVGVTDSLQKGRSEVIIMVALLVAIAIFVLVSLYQVSGPYSPPSFFLLFFC